jgi:hypothetical protein
VRGIRKNPKVVARRHKGKGFLVPVSEKMAEMRKVFELNELGWLIWQKLDEADDLAALAEIITAEFEVDPETAREDAQAFVDGLLRVGALFGEEDGGEET